MTCIAGRVRADRCSTDARSARRASFVLLVCTAIMSTAAAAGTSVPPNKAVVDVAIAMLRPVVEAAIADTAVSADRALVIVVLDGPGTQPNAPLAEYTFGNAGNTRVDYGAYARDKAQLAARERTDTSVLREREAAHRSIDLPLVGGVHRKGLTVGVSGAQPWFDEAFGVIVVEIIHALVEQRRAGESPPT